MSKIYRSLLADPAVVDAMTVVFGKANETAVRQVMEAPASVVAKFGFSDATPDGGRTASQPKAEPQTTAKPAQAKKPKTLQPKQKAVAPAKPTNPIAPAGVDKSDDDGEFEVYTEFAKFDDDEKTVFGWASIIKKDGLPVFDRQGDYIEEQQLAKSAYDYVVGSRKGGHQHKRNGEEPMQVSDMIESVVFTPEKIEKMGLPPETPVGWWVGYKVNDDEVWGAVKRGEVTGFSVHGKGKRIPMSDVEIAQIGGA